MKNILSLFGREKPHRSPGEYNLASFRNCPIYDIDLAPYLSSFLKNNWPEAVNFAKYHIYLSCGHGTSEFARVWRDASYTFILAYSDNRQIIVPNIAYQSQAGLACIGFDVDGEGVSIIIRQIQGVPSRKLPNALEKLQPFRWEKMLLRIVVDWARENVFLAVKVIRAEGSHWFSESRKRAMHMKYDVTARRSGFKFDPKERIYVLPLV